MRRHSKWLAGLLLAMLFSGAFPPAATAHAPVSTGVSSSSASGRDLSVHLVSSTTDRVTFEVAVPWEKLSLKVVQAGDRDYVRVSLPGWATTAQAGAPALPFQAQALGVPFGADVVVRVVPGKAHTRALPAPPLPAATQTVDWTPPGEDVELPTPAFVTLEDPVLYHSPAPYPAALAEVTSDGILRQQRIAGIALYPVQVQPAILELTVYESLRVEVTFLGAPSVLRQPPTESTAYEGLLEQELLNYETARAWRQAAAFSSLPPMGMAEGNPWSPPSPGWRVKVQADGLYKLSYDDLKNAGLPALSNALNLDPTTLQLFHLGSEVAIHVEGEGDGSFGQDDALLFYGQALDSSKYTSDNVYWLTYGHVTGRRMAARDGMPDAADTPTSYPAQRHMEGNQSYLTLAPGDENLDRWMWDYVYPPTRPSWSHTFALAAPSPAPATLTVALLGYLDNALNPDHHARILLNGTLVGDVSWDGIAWQFLDLPIPPGLLLAGNNTLQVLCPNDTGVGLDVVYVDWAELAFANTFTAENDELAFRYDQTGDWTFQVDGLSSAPVDVYDVTDPAAVVRVTGVSVTGSGPFSARFQDTVAAPTGYWALAEDTYRSVAAIEADAPSNLASIANGADHIVLTHNAFWTPAAQLRNHRASQGLRAMLVDVQDVYDEFGYGIASVAPIHDFLAYAYASWKAPAPAYVVLVGDGHYDPKNYRYARTSFLPPYLAPVDPWIGETAADNRYVALVGGDTFPDMMLGRLAVNTPAEASAMVNKIIAYEQTPAGSDWQQRVLAVADNADTAGNFPQFSDDLLNGYLPDTYQATRVYYGVTHSTVTDARTAIRDRINAGTLLITFVGHAATTQWAQEGLFKTSDVAGLANAGKLPVMLPMTCREGYYHYPHDLADQREALAEIVTRAENKGAVASWSPTGLGVASGHHYLSTGFFKALFQARVGTVGLAAIAGQLELWSTGGSRELIDTYLLFGDPATQIEILEADLHVAKSVEPAGAVHPGDLLTYTLTFTNVGPVTAYGVVLTDVIPTELENPAIVFASPEVMRQLSGPPFSWEIADLVPGRSGEIRVRAHIPPDALPGPLTNEVKISATNGDSEPSNNKASVQTRVLAKQPWSTYLPLVIKPR